jgi:hypothetical protein
MRVSVVLNALSDGTCAVEVDGLRIAYLRPIRGAEGQVEVTVVNYDKDGQIPRGARRHMVHIGAALKRAAKERLVF